MVIPALSPLRFYRTNVTDARFDSMSFRAWTTRNGLPQFVQQAFDILRTTVYEAADQGAYGWDDLTDWSGSGNTLLDSGAVQATAAASYDLTVPGSGWVDCVLAVDLDGSCEVAFGSVETVQTSGPTAIRRTLVGGATVTVTITPDTTVDIYGVQAIEYPGDYDIDGEDIALQPLGANPNGVALDIKPHEPYRWAFERVVTYRFTDASTIATDFEIEWEAIGGSNGPLVTPGNFNATNLVNATNWVEATYTTVSPDAVVEIVVPAFVSLGDITINKSGGGTTVISVYDEYIRASDYQWLGEDDSEDMPYNATVSPAHINGNAAIGSDALSEGTDENAVEGEAWQVTPVDDEPAWVGFTLAPDLNCAVVTLTDWASEPFTLMDGGDVLVYSDPSNRFGLFRDQEYRASFDIAQVHDDSTELVVLEGMDEGVTINGMVQQNRTLEWRRPIPAYLTTWLPAVCGLLNLSINGQSFSARQEPEINERDTDVGLYDASVDVRFPFDYVSS